jgi:hypothetical protein
MGRNLSYTKKTADRVAELAAAGMTVEATHRVLLAEGLTITRPTVGRIMQRNKAVGMVAANIDSLDLGPIKALVPKLTAMVERAMQDEEPSQVNAGLRTLGQLTAQLARLEPPIPPDPNEHPDMIAAASKCRAKLQDYVDRARGGKL